MDNNEPTVNTIKEVFFFISVENLPVKHQWLSEEMISKDLKSPLYLWLKELHKICLVLTQCCKPSFELEENTHMIIWLFLVSNTLNHFNFCEPLSKVIYNNSKQSKIKLLTLKSLKTKKSLKHKIEIKCLDQTDRRRFSGRGVGGGGIKSSASPCPPPTPFLRLIQITPFLFYFKLIFSFSYYFFYFQ